MSDKNNLMTMKEAIEFLNQQKREEEERDALKRKQIIEERERQLDPLREELAELCHEQWSNWMRYLFSKGTIHEDGTWTMPQWAVERWQHQMATDYEHLSEDEQNSDRVEANKFLEVVRPWLY